MTAYRYDGNFAFMQPGGGSGFRRERAPTKRSLSRPDQCHRSGTSTKLDLPVPCVPVACPTAGGCEQSLAKSQVAGRNSHGWRWVALMSRLMSDLACYSPVEIAFECWVMLALRKRKIPIHQYTIHRVAVTNTYTRDQRFSATFALAGMKRASAAISSAWRWRRSPSVARTEAGFSADLRA